MCFFFMFAEMVEPLCGTLNFSLLKILQKYSANFEALLNE